MSLYLTIDTTDFVLPDSAPVATIVKHLSNLRKVQINELGDGYVYVIRGNVRVSISNKHDYKDVITEAEYKKRLAALRRALPERAGPDAHGKNITKVEA